MTTWLDERANCGEGNVRACPVCGRHVLVSCYHNGMSVQTVCMTLGAAEDLRTNSGEYVAHLVECNICGQEKELAAGFAIGKHGVTCDTCVKERNEGLDNSE